MQNPNVLNATHMQNIGPSILLIVYPFLDSCGVVCLGSYMRGKASCGYMDIVITHPDGERYTSQDLQNLLTLNGTG